MYRHSLAPVLRCLSILLILGRIAGHPTSSEEGFTDTTSTSGSWNERRDGKIKADQCDAEGHSI